MISTDKAVQPINVMGATKRIAEQIVIDAAQRTGKASTWCGLGTCWAAGKRLSAFFKADCGGGPVTVTHPDMKRYFMTIPEAVYLVLQAAALETALNFHA